MFPDIGRAIRKFVPLLVEDEECNKLFSKGPLEWFINEDIRT